MPTMNYRLPKCYPAPAPVSDTKTGALTMWDAAEFCLDSSAPVRLIASDANAQV